LIGERPKVHRAAGRYSLPVRAGILLLLFLAPASPEARGATVGADPPAFAPRIDALLAEAPFQGVHWGISVVDPATGESLYERNADLRFVPASTVKIPVAAAAFGILGADFRWETRFFSESLPEGGTLRGDLVLVPSGDPTFGEPFHDSAALAIEALRSTVSGVGLARVEGELLVDASPWDSTTVVQSWMVEDLEPAYGATGGIFSIGGGALEITIRAGSAPGSPASGTWSPSGGSEFVEVSVTTVAAGEELSIDRTFLLESRRWRVTGQIPVGVTTRIRLAQRDPVRLAADAFSHAIRLSGAEILGGTRVVWDPDHPVGPDCVTGRLANCPGLLLLGGTLSPPLGEVLPMLLARSHNWTSDQVLRTLGAMNGEPGSFESGIEAVERYLRSEIGIDSLDVHLRDGSGLSAFNLMTPRSVTSILSHASRQPWGEAFRAAMASPGAGETTLENRLRGLEGRVHAKTGTISHVNALSGYVVTDDGRELVFSILTNGSNLPSSRVRDRIDQLVREIAGPA
jgi:serine-type D-Ala-D-Ala carboxypeptidase/endopeptidase (penicillin-binding protein 4)